MRSTGPSPTGPRIALAAALVGTLALTIHLANREPVWLGPLWGAAIAVLTAVAWVVWLVPEADGPTIAWSVRGPGLVVMSVVAVLYLPQLGATGLWDPWETHYGEVAREILARNDWISLWWAQDKWFWSKPALSFWLEALSMGMLGVDALPDANPAHPEWAVRLPSVLIAMAALAAVYGTLKRVFGARTAAIATLVTATTPQFFFVSHQAITDLPLVGAITIASCCFLLAVLADPERPPAALDLGFARVSLVHAMVFLLLLLVLPQALYLISRNVSWLEGAGLVAHPDRFLYGSAGNVDVPGNPTPRDQLPAVRGLLGQPFLQGLVWLAALAGVLRAVRRERSMRALWMVGFYVFCALGLLAKGLPGLVIPGAAVALYLVASGRMALLLEGGLGVSRGLAIVAAVGLPWYVAMVVRHGWAFSNRLLIHDHINRLAAGVHGDTGTIQYFVRELGYAMFPWVGLLPLAAVVLMRARGRGARRDEVDTTLFLSMWLVSSFVLFSVMVTKFHHYLLPSVIPAAVLAGVAVGRLWGPKQPVATWVAGLGGVALVAGVAWLAGDPRGVVPADGSATDDWVLQHSSTGLGLASLGFAAVLLAFGRRSVRAAETRLQPPSAKASVAIALIVGTCIVGLVGRDLSWVTSARPAGYERLAHLFVYNYRRAWPGHLDYRPILMGFAVAAAVLVGAAAASRWRSVALRALMGVAVAFCAWGLHVYMVDLAPHWSQRELIGRYYAERSDPSEPLIAWQMNWKGENFYTGNRVYVFAETDNKRFKKWIARNEGRRVYVVLEHKRLGRLEKLLQGREIVPLSTRRENNKILLVTLEI